MDSDALFVFVRFAPKVTVIRQNTIRRYVFREVVVETAIAAGRDRTDAWNLRVA